VESINLRGATDEAIWSFARDHGFTLVSKDDDFRSLALVRGAPPKVIWLQIGNAPTSKVAELLRANLSILEHFADEPGEALISLRG
jgi:predicted nuclease of predicted toxin-antitoxin system